MARCRCCCSKDDKPTEHRATFEAGRRKRYDAHLAKAHVRSLMNLIMGDPSVGTVAIHADGFILEVARGHNDSISFVLTEN